MEHMLHDPDCRIQKKETGCRDTFCGTSRSRALSGPRHSRPGAFPGPGRQGRHLFAAYHIVRVILGLTFVYASMHKILDPIAFALAVNNYRILPADLVNFTALVLPWIELIAGTLLLLNVWTPGAALAVCGLLVIFTGAVTFSMARGLDIACGCFTASPAKGGMNLLTLCRDCSFLVLSFFLLFMVLREPRAGLSPQKEGSRRCLWAVMLMIFLGVAGWGEARAAADQVFVLCYHSFHGNGRFEYDVSLQDLGSQMDELAGRGFCFVTYADLLEGRVAGTKNVLVVIDDGNQSVYQAYRQVFEPRGIRPVLGIYPNVIGKKSYALTWEQLTELSRAGCGIAGHGYYHLLLSQKFYEEDSRAFIKEIVLSKQTLEDRLGVKVTSFVYPSGAASEAAKKLLRETGYECAFTIRWGRVLVPLGSNPDPYELSRYMVTSGNWPMISGALRKAAAE